MLDTNVLLSAMINPRGTPSDVVRRWNAGEFGIVTSTVLISELEELLSRPRVVRHLAWSEEERQRLRTLLSRAVVEVATGTPARRVPTDPDDDHVVEAAIAGDADVIVSGDRDLLALGSIEGIEVVTPARFLAMLRFD